MLKELPLPSQNKSGWPWTEESELLPSTQANGLAWPKISIITPSLNQGKFIEETIRSILLQNYPNLEYIIIDGGSTDNTIEIIKKYSAWISSWISEPDRGQSDAINKGFKRSTGEMVNWICSDDMLNKNALFEISKVLRSTNSIIISGGFRIGEEGRILNELSPSTIYKFEQLVNIKKHWRSGDSILQQGTLYPLRAVKKTGYLNENNHYTMDYELWGKIFADGVSVINFSYPVGIFRWYDGQKTSHFDIVTKSLIKTAKLLVRQNINLTTVVRASLLIKVYYYAINYIYHKFRSFIGIRRRLKLSSNG